jgi:hypothetical protein
MTEIDFTVLAERQYAALKGPCRKAMDEFLRDLSHRGCGAISGRTGYRLSGQAPVNRLCDRHLHGEDRVIVAFEDQDLAVVLTIAPHRAGHPRDVYANLWAACGLAEPRPARSPNRRAVRATAPRLCYFPRKSPRSSSAAAHWHARLPDRAATASGRAG